MSVLVLDCQDSIAGPPNKRTFVSAVLCDVGKVAGHDFGVLGRCVVVYPTILAPCGEHLKARSQSVPMVTCDTLCLQIGTAVNGRCETRRCSGWRSRRHLRKIKITNYYCLLLEVCFFKLSRELRLTRAYSWGADAQ